MTKIVVLFFTLFVSQSFAKSVLLSQHLKLNFDEKKWSSVYDKSLSNQGAYFLKELSSKQTVVHRKTMKPFAKEYLPLDKNIKKVCDSMNIFKGRVEPTITPFLSCKLKSEKENQIVIFVPIKTIHRNVFEVHSFYTESKSFDLLEQLSGQLKIRD